MSIGSWTPESGQQEDKPIIELTTLEPLLEFSQQAGPEQLATKLPPEIIQSHAWLMRTHKDSWFKIAARLDNQQLIALVRFFTLAEEQLPGWEAENKSPVIWLCRELKNRGQFPDPELIDWIKSHSSNKFLPYGNILDL